MATNILPKKGTKKTIPTNRNSFSLYKTNICILILNVCKSSFRKNCNHLIFLFT